MVIEDEKPNPAEVRSRLREAEDFNLAMKLQDEEYHRHYNLNRSERRIVGSDTKASKSEQLREDEESRRRHREALRPIEQCDEELARKFAAQFEAEEQQARQQRERQLREDERLALMLSSNEEISGLPLNLPQQPLQSISSTEIPIGASTPGRRTSAVLLPGIVRSESIATNESDVDWPAPPPPSALNQNLFPPAPGFVPSLWNSTNPFLRDLVSAPSTTEAHPSAAVTSLAIQQSPPPPPYTIQSAPNRSEFRSEFGLPPPSDLALGLNGIGSHQNRHQ